MLSLYRIFVFGAAVFSRAVSATVCSNIEICRNCGVSDWFPLNGQSCNQPEQSGETEASCRAYLDNDSTLSHVIWKPQEDNKCQRSNCIGLPQYSSNKVIYNNTCRTECLDYSLQRFEDTQITTAHTTMYSNVNEDEDCLYYCLQTSVPCAVTYIESSKSCYVYMGCSNDCQRSGNSGFKTFSRTCSGCGDPETITNGAVSSFTSPVSDGTVVVYTCDTGYYMSSGSSTRSCSGGSWNSSLPVCSPTDCGTPSPPPNSNSVVDLSNGTVYGSFAQYTCLSGYTLAGDSRRFCGADGNWNGTVPVCDIVICTTPIDPTNGYTNNISGYSFGSYVEYLCDTGYTLSGENMSFCGAEGNWNGTVPACDIVNCTTPVDPTNGYTNYISGYSFGSYVEYHCDAGYTLSGENMSFCGADGIWNGTVPVCDIVNCSTPIDPTNGYTNYISGFSFGSYVEYLCDTGYTLSGANMSFCGADGNWNGTVPNCELINCTNPAPPTNGGIGSWIGNKLGDNVTFYCNPGYDISGNNVSFCQADGLWTDTPLCNIRDCGTVPSFTDGSVTLQNSSTTYGSVALYSCNDILGLELNSTDQRQCLDNGSWSFPIPVCVLKDCGVPQLLPANGAMVLTNGTLVGASVSFTCLPGFSPSPTNIRTCETTGLWSDSTVTCIAFSTGPTSTSTTPSVSSTTPQQRDRLFLMPCLCNNNSYFAGLSTDEIIALLEAELTIDATETALAVSKLKCRTDDRQSSEMIGLFSIAFMSSILGLLVFCDLLTICKHRDSRRNKTAFGK